MKKKICCILLSMAMILALMPNMAFAEGSATVTEGTITGTITGEQLTLSGSDSNMNSYSIELFCNRLFESYPNITSIHLDQNWKGGLTVYILNDIYKETVKKYTADEENLYWSAYNGVLFDNTGDLLFPGAKKDNEYTLPQNITKLGTISGTSYLEKIVIPKSVKDISIGAFDSITNLKTISVEQDNSVYSSEDKVLFSKDKTKLIRYPRAKEGIDYSIPDSVNTIEKGAFSGCRSLTSVKIPEKVTQINASVFSGCTGLKKVTLHDSITTISDDAFWNCSSLTNIEFPDSLMSIGESAFGGTGLTSMKYPNATQIGNYAFVNCNALKSVDFSGIDDTFYFPEEGAFSGCNNLTDFYFGEKMQNLNYSTLGVYGVNCHYSCKIKDWVRSETFANGYKAVIEHGTITDNRCTVCYETVKNPTEKVDGKCGNNASYSYDGNGTLTISGSGAISSFRYWKDSSGNTPYYLGGNVSNIVMSDQITAINSSAFDGFWALETVDFSNSLESIGSKAFRSSSYLKELNLPNGLKTIGAYAFQGCSSLTMVDIPDSLEYIGNYAFRWCDKLTTVDLSGNLERIGIAAFSQNYNITKVTFGNNIKYIGNYAFNNCRVLKQIELPSSLQTIGQSAFKGCAFKEINIPNTIRELGYEAFLGCKNLSTVTFDNDFAPDYVEDGIFKSCSSLKTIELPASMTKIPNGMFKNSGIETINLSGVKDIGNSAFAYCANLKKVDIPGSVEWIGYRAFVKNEWENSFVDNQLNASIKGNIKGMSGILSDSRYSPFSKDAIVEVDCCYVNDSIKALMKHNNVILKHDFASNGNCKFCTETKTSVEELTPVGNILRYPIDKEKQQYLLFDETTKSITGILEFDEPVTNLKIPGKVDGRTVSAIEKRAFYNNDNLKTVEIAEGLKTIGSKAFADCDNLKEAKLPDSLKELSLSAFDAGCKLTNKPDGTVDDGDGDGDISGGGSSGGGSTGGGSINTGTQYEVTVYYGKGGTIQSTVDKVGTSTSILFSIVPDKGYEVESVTVNGKKLGAIEVYKVNGLKSDIEIYATFKLVGGSTDKTESIIKGVKATTIKAKSTVGKGYIKVSWTKSKGYKVDAYEVFRSKKKYSRYVNFYETSNGKRTSYKNTKNLRKGTRYYYKVRGVREIDGKLYYTKWSNRVYRIAK